MGYVSNNLTHFVGRSLDLDQQRYELLAKVIRGGVLLDPAHIGCRDPFFRVTMVDESGKNANSRSVPGLEYSSQPNVRHDVMAKLSDNKLLQFEIVCFCDIPEDELALHCSKYSHFGLAFSKQFLARRGACPVMYVPKPGHYHMTVFEHDSNSGEQNYKGDKNGALSELVDRLFKFHLELSFERFTRLQEYIRSVMFEGNDEGTYNLIVEDLRNTVFLQNASEAFIFSHLKFFDPLLAEGHSENYYMEREWRVAGKVEFDIGNIEAIYVSQSFAHRAAQDFPELNSRIRPL